MYIYIYRYKKEPLARYFCFAFKKKEKMNALTDVIN